MTQPTQPTQGTKNVAPRNTRAQTEQLVRALISIIETIGFIVAAVLAGMNNGQDFKHAIFAAMLAFVAHGVNHNSGGSPI